MKEEAKVGVEVEEEKRRVWEDEGRDISEDPSLVPLNRWSEKVKDTLVMNTWQDM